MKRFAILATSIAVSLTTWLAPAPADALPGDAVSLSVGNFTKVADACVSHPYAASVVFGPTTLGIELQMRVTGPQNEFVDSATVAVTSPGVVALEVTICANTSPTGTYTISGDGIAWDASLFESAVAITPVQFQVFDPPTKDVKGKAPEVDKRASLRKFGVTFATKPTPEGYEEGEGYTWKVLVNGQKVKKFLQGADDTLSWTSSKLPVGEVQKLVIKGNGEVRYTGKMTPK